MSQTLKFCIAFLPTDFLISGSSLLLTESILHTRYCKSAGTEHILGQVNIEREKKKKKKDASYFPSACRLHCSDLCSNYYLHLLAKTNEQQRDEVTCTRSYAKFNAELTTDPQGPGF